MAAGRSEDVSFWLEPKLNLLTNFKNMWFIVTFLIAVQYMPSACGKNLILTDSNPSASFQTTRFKGNYNGRKRCPWVVCAPRYVKELYLVCDLEFFKSPGCSCGSFSFFNCGRKITICKEKKIEVILQGDQNVFTFIRSWTPESLTVGVSCTVSYDPKDYPNFINPSCNCGEKEVLPIIDGNEATPNEFPWLAMLMDKSNVRQLCGGSLIADKWVLTAANCLASKTASDILIALRSDDKASSDSSPHFHPVNKIIIHEEYGKLKERDSDIGLLELVSPVIFNEVISPICLPFKYKDHDFNRMNGIIAGCSHTKERFYLSKSNIFTEIVQKIIMPSQCISSHGQIWERTYITQNMICGESTRVCPCKRDTGGPLVWRSDSSGPFYQLGIMSRYIGCGDQPKPTFYTRVSKFVDWIKGQTGYNFCVKE